jgi:CHASE2 domain-containing sensor protein
VVLGVRHLGGVEYLELKIFDQMIRLRADEGPDPRLVVVGITEEDIQQQQQWPISDRVFAELFAKFASSSAEINWLRYLPGFARCPQKTGRT